MLYWLNPVLYGGRGTAWLFPGLCGCRVGCTQYCVDVESTCLTGDCDVGVMVRQRTVYMCPSLCGCSTDCYRGRPCYLKSLFYYYYYYYVSAYRMGIHIVFSSAFYLSRSSVRQSVCPSRFRVRSISFEHLVGFSINSA